MPASQKPAALAFTPLTSPRLAPGASSSSRPPTSPPPSLSATTATTMATQPIHAHAQLLPRSSAATPASASANASAAAAAAAVVASNSAGGGSGSSSSSSAAAAVGGPPSPLPPAPLQPTLPSGDTQRHVVEARAAVVASLSNMVDSELQSRASILHDNAAALDKQERDVARATDALRREREKLAREADAAARRLKEVGNVQNWAEVLERGFLVLEETVRLANGGREVGPDGEDDGTGSYAGSSCTCSCSECGSEGGRDADEMDADADDDAHRDGGQGGDDGGSAQSKMPHELLDGDVDMVMTTDSEGGPGTWSDASRSLMEPDSSTGTDTGRAKGSETASVSTTA